MADGGLAESLSEAGVAREPRWHQRQPLAPRRPSSPLAVELPPEESKPEEHGSRGAGAPLSVIAATVTLTQTILGSGVLALPYAIKSAGLVGGLGMLAFMYALTALSMGVVVLVSSHTGKFSYAELAAVTLGDNAARWVAVWFLVFTLGICVAYPVVLGDFLSALIADLFPSAGLWGSQRVTMAVGILAVCWPLSCAPSLSFLKWSSAVGVSAILLSTAVVVKRYFDGSYRGHGYKTNAFAFFNASEFGNCFPILVSAMAAHFNIPGLFREVAPEAGALQFACSEEGKAAFRRMMRVIVGALTVSCSVYCLVGVVVYATFGPDTKDDFSENFKSDDGLLVLVRATMAAAICATFPLVMVAARNAAHDLFLRPRGVQMGFMVRVSLATALTGVCLGVAEAVGSLGPVLDFNGAVFGTPVSYIVPMAMYLALPRDRQDSRWRLFSFACALLGLLFGLLGVVVAGVGAAKA